MIIVGTMPNNAFSEKVANIDFYNGNKCNVDIVHKMLMVDGHLFWML